MREALFGELVKSLDDDGFAWVALAGPNAFCNLFLEDIVSVGGELCFKGNSPIFRAAKLMEDYAVAYMMTKSLQVFRKQLNEEQLRNMLQSVIRKTPDPNEFTLKTKYNHIFRSGSCILRLICVWQVGCKIGVSVAVESAPAAAAPAAAAPAAAAPAALSAAAAPE
jgi:hypothetical protein